MTRNGTVYLVGAGPGDPELITVRGRKLLRCADVIVHDRLVPLELLAHARREAEILDVGKFPGAHGVRQVDINEFLVDRARRGLCVVRLKGGDPFVFGRGFEELTACRVAGVECIVIPGVSSALAAPLAAGISVTARGASNTVAIVTAETASGSAPVDFEKLSGIDTLVILMGRARLSEIVHALVQAGKDPSTPAACIERATTPRQRVVSGTLATLVELVNREGLSAPIVTVVGETARQADAWFSRIRAPLTGKRIVVTRPRSASRELDRLLTAVGARVIRCPLIRVAYAKPGAPTHVALNILHTYPWIAFTSQHGVIGLWKQLRAAGLDARALSGRKLAAIGGTTARTLERIGLAADVMASTPDGQALTDSLLKNGATRVLYPCGDLAMRRPVEALRAAGAEIKEWIVYQTQQISPTPAGRAAVESGADAILFFSPSAVRSFVENGLVPGGAVVACIGPTTAASARSLGLEVGLVADDHSCEGLVRGLADHFQSVGVQA